MTGDTKQMPLVAEPSGGNFDFRSVLRKTNLLDVDDDDRQRQQQVRAPDVQQVDFRSVLRRKAIS